MEAAIRMYRCLAGLCLLLIALADPLLSQDVTLSAGMTFGAVYVPDGWTALRLSIHNRTPQAIEGTVRILPYADNNTPEFRTPVRVQPQSRLERAIWIRLPAIAARKSSLGLVTLNDQHGAQLARTELSGKPGADQAEFSRSGRATHGYLICITGANPSSDPEVGGVDALDRVYSTLYDWKTSATTLDSSNAPRSAVPYSSAYAVQLRDIDPQEIDPAQQSALADYVAGGGVLIISQPDPHLIRGSWLESWLPVRLMGVRKLHQIKATSDAAPRPMSQWFDCTEALPGDGEILLADGQYVYAARRQMGLGQIVFTAFPPGAFDLSDPRAMALWTELLNLGRAPIGPDGSRFATDYAAEMEPLLGKQAASWNVAAGAALGFVVLVIAAQLFWRGAGRPRAFAASLGAAVAISAVFAAMALFRQQSDPHQQATLRYIDITSDGYAVTEFSTVSGPQTPTPLSRHVTDEQASLLPDRVRQDRLTMWQWPIELQQLQVRPQEAMAVTRSARVGRMAGVKAVGQFGPDGLQVTVENHLEGTIGSTQLVWDLQRLAMVDLLPGETRTVLTANHLRPADEFTARPGLTTQAEQHRGRLAQLALTSAAAVIANPPSSEMALIGWIDNWRPLTQLQGVELSRDVSLNFVRIPLSLAPTPAGSKVRLDGCFNELVTGDQKGLPFDPASRQFIQSSMEGSWPLGIRLPRSVGRIRPEKARLTIDLQTPRHKLTIRKGQSPSGDTLAEFDSQVGLQQVRFDCTPDDLDRDGILWLNLQIASTGGGGSLGVLPHWRIARLTVDIEGEVIKAASN